MSGRIEEAKDELAARALSRLAEPMVPEGLAARIKARAVATPQGPGEPAGPAAPMTAEASMAPAPLTRRWAAYAAAASLAAVALAWAVLPSGTREDASGGRLGSAAFCRSAESTSSRSSRPLSRHTGARVGREAAACKEGSAGAENGTGDFHEPTGPGRTGDQGSRTRTVHAARRKVATARIGTNRAATAGRQ